jgi:hypothetical protein
MQRAAGLAALAAAVVGLLSALFMLLGARRSDPVETKGDV